MLQPQPTGPLALVGCAGQESHVIGLRMVCDFLQANNWRIHWLPANDRTVVRNYVASLKPDALLLSIGLDTALTPTRRVITDLRASGFTGLVIVGGRAIDRDASRVEAIGADLTARDGLQLVRLLRPRFPAMRPD
jgi:methanogenic corrinoid protein MtbC1